MMATARDTGSSGSLLGSFLDFGGFWPDGPLDIEVVNPVGADLFAILIGLDNNGQVCGHAPMLGRHKGLGFLHGVE
jgi:hypothetical protein